MSEDTAARSGTGIRLLAVARVALLAGWVLWAASSWWMAPREGTIAQARADLAAGRMVSYQTGASWQDDDWQWEPLPIPGPVSRDGSFFLWETTDFRAHYANPEGPDADRQATALTRALADANLATRWFIDAPVLVGMMSVVLGLVFLAVLVAGPAPVTGTRWFWFLLVFTAPFTLGLVYWLVRERPWSRTATRPSGPADSDPRRRWYLGVALGIASSLAASVLVFGLQRVLGEGLVP